MTREEEKEFKALKRLHYRPKKSIGELLYGDTHDLRALFLFVKHNELETFGRTRYPYASARARKDYGIPLPNAANYIASYIERLQDEITRLKTETNPISQSGEVTKEIKPSEK